MEYLKKRVDEAGLRYDATKAIWDGYKTFRHVGFDVLGKHYGEWSNYAKNNNLLPIEYLVPRLVVPFSSRLPRAMAEVEGRSEEAAKRFMLVNGNNWGYYFHLGGGCSTLGEENEFDTPKQLSKFRCLHRLRVIAEGLEAIFLGRFSTMTVLDFACNWGAFSLELSARSAKSVVGIDLREENIRKAQALAAYTGVSGSVFKVGNVYDISPDDRRDIVLNLGLMYHVTKQYELVKATYDLCNVACVIETITHKEPFSGFILGTGDKVSAQHAAGEIGAELHPTYRGLIDMMLMVGFKTIVELDGDPDPNWIGYSSDVFGRKLRRILVGFKIEL